eukprot:4652354-Amphidinium_carterae.4
MLLRDGVPRGGEHAWKVDVGRGMVLLAKVNVSQCFCEADALVDSDSWRGHDFGNVVKRKRSPAAANGNLSMGCVIHQQGVGIAANWCLLDAALRVAWVEVIALKWAWLRDGGDVLIAKFL